MKKVSRKLIVMLLTVVMVMGSAVSVFAATISKTVYTNCNGATSSADYVSIKHIITKSEEGDVLTFRAEANTSTAYSKLYHIQYQAEIYISMESVSSGKTSYAKYSLNEVYDISQADGEVLPYTLTFDAKKYYQEIDGELYRGKNIVWTGNVTATMILKDGRTATSVIEGLERT